jgi:alkyl hydroperoxide reductase subunit AhpC
VCPSTGSGVTGPLRKPVTCTLRCSRTLSPKGAIARAYGAYRSVEGVSERALFVIDKNGIISWSYCSPIAVNPGADGILEALERLPKEEKIHG